MFDYRLDWSTRSAILLVLPSYWAVFSVAGRYLESHWAPIGKDNEHSLLSIQNASRIFSEVLPEALPSIHA